MEISDKICYSFAACLRGARWERSPNASNSTNFMNVNNNGNPSNNNNASNTNGLALGFNGCRK